MEEHKKELENLRAVDPKNRRSVFLEYCKKNIERQEKNEIEIEQASCLICCACSVFFEQIMPEFEEVMNIACDLELTKYYSDRPQEDWEILKRIINKAKL